MPLVIEQISNLPDKVTPTDKSIQKKKEGASSLESDITDIDLLSEKYVAHVAVPSQKEVEEYLIQRRKRHMLDLYVDS